MSSANSGNSENVKRISKMTLDDIKGIRSLYRVNVDCTADYGDIHLKHELLDGRVVDIVQVELPREVSVDTLQKILFDGLKSLEGIRDVCIYYVKNAGSAFQAGEIMNDYSQEHPGYKKKERRTDVNHHILHLNLPKGFKGGRHHQRSTRRGKGNCRGKKSRSYRSRSSRSRSSRSLRRSRR